MAEILFALNRHDISLLSRWMQVITQVVQTLLPAQIVKEELFASLTLLLVQVGIKI